MMLTNKDLSKPHFCGLSGRHYGVCPACEARLDEDEALYPLDPRGYNVRVEQLVEQGMDRGDAQGVAECEYEQHGEFLYGT